MLKKLDQIFLSNNWGVKMKLNNVHPGEIMLTEYILEDWGLSHELADIILHKKNITPEIDMVLGVLFCTSVGYWLGLQRDYDKEEIKMSEQEYFNYYFVLIENQITKEKRNCLLLQDSIPKCVFFDCLLNPDSDNKNPLLKEHELIIDIKLL